MTVEDFAELPRFVLAALRVFELLDAPFVPHHEAADWALSSVRTAASVGATACAVIPTRGGNGAIDALPAESRPRLGLRDLEWVVQEALSDGRSMRVFADLWDIARLFDCACSQARAARLAQMNREQRVPPPVGCACAGR
jgi:hypothetical protein